MTLRILLCVAALAGWTGAVQAQPEETSRAYTGCYVNTFTSVPGETVVPALVGCPGADYPLSSSATGAQGFVSVEGVVTKQGTVVSPRITDSIVTPELNAAALNAVALAKFRPGKDAQGTPLEVPFMITVEFWKDDPKNVSTKSCGDFVTDAQWFKSGYPQMKFHEMHLYYVVVERLGTDAFEHHVDPSKVQGAGTRLLPAFDAAYEHCAAKPEANFLTTLRTLAKLDW